MRKLFTDCMTKRKWKAKMVGEILVLKTNGTTNHFYEAKKLHPWVEAFPQAEYDSILTEDPEVYYRLLGYPNGLVQAEVNFPILFNMKKGLFVAGFSMVTKSNFDFQNITDHLDENLVSNLWGADSGKLL